MNDTQFAEIAAWIGVALHGGFDWLNLRSD